MDFQKYLDAVDTQHERVAQVLTQISRWTGENSVPGDQAKFLSAIRSALKEAGVNEVDFLISQEPDLTYEEVDDYHFPPKLPDGTWAQLEPDTYRYLGEYGYSFARNTWVLRIKWIQSNDPQVLGEWHIDG